MLSLTRRSFFTAASGLFVLPPLAYAAESAATDGLANLDRFIGSWRGEGDGEPGHSTVERTYEKIPGGSFVLCRNLSIYAPQEKNPKGETHTDIGYFSYDKARKLLVLRQFHPNEGFVNQYTSTGFSGNEMAMNSEAIENIPAGWRARETYRFEGADSFEEIFELSKPGSQTFALYSHNKLRRA